MHCKSIDKMRVNEIYFIKKVSLSEFPLITLYEFFAEWKNTFSDSMSDVEEVM